MPRLVQKSSYVKGGKAGGYMNYIATRENVEKLDGNDPVTENQQQLIQNLVRDFPDTKDTHEYEDYESSPTFGNASALITVALERNADEARGREQYLKYMATRPRVERLGEHGLFSSAPSVSLDAALHELKEYDGNVYTFIYSLRREDAERLGYDNAEAWRTLLCGKQVELATAMNIPPDKLHWYAAFHDEGHHPHIHMMVWSDDPKQGYLTKGGIEKMRSELTTTIFQDELLNLYQEKDMSYKEVARSAREAMRDLISEMKESICDVPEIEKQLVTLSESLASAKGKKQYQYLKKDVKRQVDAIVDALAELPQVAECYEAWNRCKDALDNNYHDRERERKLLSQQPEFRAIKNMVIREADGIRRNVFTFEDERMDDEPEPEENLLPLTWEQRETYFDAKEKLCDDYASREEKAEAVSALEELAKAGSGDAAYLLGKAWRDGLCAPPWPEEAKKWFLVAARRGNNVAQYAVGKLLIEEGKLQTGVDWLAYAADHGNDFARYRLGRMGLVRDGILNGTERAIEDLTDAAKQGNQYAQYTLGKVYLQGFEVGQNMELAEYWLSRAADHGHAYAQFFLDHRNEPRKPSVTLAVSRLLHCLGGIFESNRPSDATSMPIQIDRKRRKEMLEKRIAMGHKPDDHEEQSVTMNASW